MVDHVGMRKSPSLGTSLPPAPGDRRSGVDGTGGKPRVGGSSGERDGTSEGADVCRDAVDGAAVGPTLAKVAGDVPSG